MVEIKCTKATYKRIIRELKKELDLRKIKGGAE